VDPVEAPVPDFLRHVLTGSRFDPFQRAVDERLEQTELLEPLAEHEHLAVENALREIAHFADMPDFDG
jgi:hypothetical protein